MRLPPGVSSADFSDALKQFEEAVGKDWVFTSDEDVDLYRDSYSPFWHEEEEPFHPRPSLRTAWKRCRRSSRSRMAIRFRCGRSRRARIWATVARLRCFPAHGPRPEADGSRSRGEREECVRPGRAGRQLFRPLPLHPGSRAKGVDRPRRSRLGQPGRKRPGSRRRANSDARSLRRCVRHGSRTAEWRGDAHRHGRAARIQNVAAIQIRIRAVRRRHVFAIEPGDRHHSPFHSLHRIGKLPTW